MVTTLKSEWWAIALLILIMCGSCMSKVETKANDQVADTISGCINIGETPCQYYIITIEGQRVLAIKSTYGGTGASIAIMPWQP